MREVEGVWRGVKGGVGVLEGYVKERGEKVNTGEGIGRETDDAVCML